ncbi:MULTISPECIES: type I secretion system permease/ATPase [Roseobacteraceae]|uniref:Type I secretion system ATP-binding protein PrsD n=1 Tax=Pseudosulfitobacter pseudonitzschiae TaxID=1402135 RepID=A0A221K8K9_9RHOB|nr:MULTISPECIES: type I secretion system permease/ATPase [Roseobacteraceae]ASM75200.1 type I secretion system ATP-binding protein PrsD [Pseudosulfitobacter pseudonitzschiae]
MKTSNGLEPSRSSIAAAATALKKILLGIAGISAVINLLTLTAPLFMLQVYDRVIPSQSIPTLLGFAALAVMLYTFQAILEILRARTLLRLGEGMDAYLSRDVHMAVVRKQLRSIETNSSMQIQRDLDNLRNFLGSQGPSAFFDLPWLPIYLGLCFLLHVWIGVTALIGAVILIALTLLTAFLTDRPARATVRFGNDRMAALDAARRNADSVLAMGFERRLEQRWQQINRDYLALNRRTGDVSNLLGGISRALRMMLQSGILAVGAWLVIEQEATAGVMIASSIMMGRALSPVDKAIANWKSFTVTRQGWSRLKSVVEDCPLNTKAVSLPTPSQNLEVRNLAIAAPGERKPLVQGVSMTLQAGSALGIIGPSGSGKSSLARALTGIWPTLSGSVRLDGAKIDQWTPEALGPSIGYLPQGVELFDGTVAENIARFDPEARSEEVITAARAADVHELILRLEQGYETRLGEGGLALSSGQRQRIGLARALYGAPFLVVLDEPNANLDAEGEAAVTRAVAGVSERGGIAIIIVHRPSAIAATDHVLMMSNGRVKAFGSRDEVLGKVLKKRPSGGGQIGQSVAAVSYLVPRASELSMKPDGPDDV